MAAVRIVTLLALALAVAMLSRGGSIALAGDHTYVVTRTDDSADGDCDNDCSLREAVIAANDNPGEDTIMLAAATYELDIDAVQPDNDGALTGDLDIESDTIVQGVSQATTIIDAGGE
jgi:CSLREA domain-containing protein